MGNIALSRKEGGGGGSSDQLSVLESACERFLRRVYQLHKLNSTHHELQNKAGSGIADVISGAKEGGLVLIAKVSPHVAPNAFEVDSIAS